MAPKHEAHEARREDQKKPASEGNRYTRAARVLAKELADRAFTSESTAARCLEAWRACVAELIEVGRLLDPVKATQKKAVPKPKPVPVAKPAATEPTATPDETVGTTAI